MHGIHCGSSVFPYQAFERRRAQKTVTGSADMHKKRLGGIEYCKMSGSQGGDYEDDRLLRIEHSLCKRNSSTQQGISNKTPCYVSPPTYSLFQT
jgi:hypothetical protein